MSDAKVVRLKDTEVVPFGPLAHYQPIIGDDEGTTPIRTGIQTSQPGYEAPVHSHPYLEVLHILDGTDHLLFLLCVVIPFRRLGPLVVIVTSFTVAHSITLLASAFGREAGRVALVGVLVAVISYLVNAVATLWSKAEFLRPYSLHHYFDPREVLVNGHLAASSASTLALVAALAAAIAFSHFARRDLP